MGEQLCQRESGTVDVGRGGGLAKAGRSRTIPSRGRRPSPRHTARRQPRPPGTLISGTTILDSGFLSNMRVIRSFKSSAMSGLGVGDTSGAGDRHAGPPRAQAKRCIRRAGRHSLVWKFQGLTLDLTV